MTLIVIVIIVVATVMVMFTSDRIASHRNVQRREQLKDWDNWDTPERARVVRNMSLDHGDEISRLRRAFLIFAVGVAAVGAWGLFSLQDVVHEQCSDARELSTQNEHRVTEEIRQRQQRRNDLADQIASDQETRANAPDIETLPSFRDLDPAAQVFVRGAYADSQASFERSIEDAQRRLAIYDDDLVRLREELDAVRKFNSANSSCPA